MSKEAAGLVGLGVVIGAQWVMVRHSRRSVSELQKYARVRVPPSARGGIIGAIANTWDLWNTLKGLEAEIHPPVMRPVREDPGTIRKRIADELGVDDRWRASSE